MLSTAGLRVEKIPGLLADLEEPVTLLPLCLWAVATGTERSSPSRGRAVSERGAGTLFVLGSCPSSAGASGGIGHPVARVRRGRCRGLRPSVVDNLGQKLGPAVGKLGLGLFGRLVFPRPVGCWAMLHRRGVAGRRQGAAVAAGIERGGRIVRVSRQALAEDIRDGRQTIASLGGRDVVDVRGVGEC